MKILNLAILFSLFPLQTHAFENLAESRLQPLIDALDQSPDLPDRYQGYVSKKIGLYADVGSWDTGKRHLKLFFQKYGYTYQSLSAQDILSGVLANEKIDLLYMPGGESWTYLASLGEAGAQKIKEFISAGGSYAGICAGAFYATSDREGGYKTGPYGIGLLQGTAFDGTDLKKDPFIEGMLNFNMLIPGLLPIYKIALLGGPSFRYSPVEALKKNIEVLAQFQKILEPAMIRFRYGNGKVFLSAPHPEIEENLTDWGKDYNDPESDWPILQVETDWLIDFDRKAPGISQLHL